MPQMAIEEIEALRGGEKSIWFAGVKGFLLTFVKEAIPTVLIGAVAGAIVAGAAMLGVGMLQTANVLTDGFLKEGGLFGYISSVALTSGALSGLLVSAKGAYHEVNHARSINQLIDLEVQSAKGRAHERVQQAAPSLVQPERPDYIQKIIEKGAESGPQNQLSKLLKEREASELSKEVTIH